MSVALSKSVFGRFIASIGSNPVSAHFFGVPVERTVVIAHTIAGVMSALAAVVQTASLAVGIRFGPEIVMNSIAATILGGVIFGRGARVWGPFFGVLSFAMLFVVLTTAGVQGQELGGNFEIIEEGLSARTTSIDDPVDPRLNGSAYLPAALASHLPLDLVILMLGTNDTKSFYKRTPYEVAVGMSKLVIQVLTSGGGVGTVYPPPKVLMVAPPPLADMPDPWFQGMFEGSRQKTVEVAAHYRALAAFMKVDFLDAGSCVVTQGVDGIHFTADNNRDLGIALAAKVKEIVLGNQT